MTFRMNWRLGAILAATLVVSACGGGNCAASGDIIVDEVAVSPPPPQAETTRVAARIAPSRQFMRKDMLSPQSRIFR